MGLEGLEVTHRSIDGLDTDRPDLAGILSRNLQPHQGLYSDFPLSSEDQRVEGFHPLSGIGNRQSKQGIGLGPRTLFSSGHAVFQGGGAILPGVESLKAP